MSKTKQKFIQSWCNYKNKNLNSKQYLNNFSEFYLYLVIVKTKINYMLVSIKAFKYF